MNCSRGDRRVLAVRLAGAALAFAALSAASAQGSYTFLAARGQAPEELQGRLLRVIDDPNLGLRWLLVRDPAQPAGPARLVLASTLASTYAPAGEADGKADGKADDKADGNADAGASPLPAAFAAQAARLRPVIRAGDRLLLEQDSDLARVRLEAVAMQPAAAGAALRARLAIGGKVVRAVALGPGRAAFAPGREGWQ